MRSESEKLKMIFYSSGPPHQCPCQIILSQLMSLRFSMDYFPSNGKPLHRILHILVVNTSSSERYPPLLQQMMGCFLNICYRYHVVIIRFLHDEKGKKNLFSHSQLLSLMSLIHELTIKNLRK